MNKPELNLPKLRQIAEAHQRDLCRETETPFHEAFDTDTVLAMLDKCDQFFVDPQGAAQVLGEANARLREEVEVLRRSACSCCYTAGTVLVAIDDADTCPACGGTGNEKVWQLTQILRLIEAEGVSPQSAFNSLLTCVNLACKGLGMEYDDSAEGANG